MPHQHLIISPSIYVKKNVKVKIARSKLSLYCFIAEYNQNVKVSYQHNYQNDKLKVKNSKVKMNARIPS